MPSAAGLRVVGVALPDVSDWTEPMPEGQWSQFFSALAQRIELVGVVRPELTRTQKYLNLARTFHPRLSRWRASAGFNASLASMRTASAQRGLTPFEGSYDLIMQLQTLCAPPRRQAGAPYAIYTDNTMALTRRLNPLGRGTHLSAAAAARWMGLESEVCRAANAVFTYSEFARASVVDDYDCPPERVLAVGAGANQLLESVAGKDYSAPRALFVGIDFKRKGGPTLLEAWPTVRARLPDAQLVIAGPLQPPAAELPVGVRWVGRADRRELALLYRSASLFVMPSIFEAWGLVFPEAMGHGLACVGTSICAMPEIIQEGVTGRLVPRCEAAPLAQALIELLGDPATMARMGQAAHAHVLNGNRWSDVAERVASHLAHSLPDGAPPARAPSGGR